MEDSNFENIALRYSDIVDKKPIHIYYERPNLTALLPANIGNLKVLDIGCGSGWYSEFLSNRGALVTAIDNSPTMVELTKKRSKNVEVFLADISQPLDFLANANFDIIIAPLVIHYIQEWIPLFQELSKKLKVNGLFLFSTHSPFLEYTAFKLENYFEKVKIIDEWKDIGKVEFYHHTLHQLSDALFRTGFILEIIQEPQPLEEMKKVDEKMYNNLTTKPWFLFGRARKIT